MAQEGGLAEERSAPSISYDDFARIDIRVGTVVAVEAYPEARRPAYKLRIEFGPGIGMRQSSAQLTTHYRQDELLGRQVAAVVNFPPRQIGRFISEVLILGFPDGAGATILIGPDRPIPDGGRLY